MKKYMVADLIKESREKLEEKDIPDFAKEIDRPVDQVKAIWDNGIKYRDQIKQVYEYTDNNDVDPEEFDEIDLENLDEMGWSGFIGSSIGDIEYEYDITNQYYNVTINFKDGKVAEYALDPDDVINMDGNYYNENIRILDRNYYPFRNKVPNGPNKLRYKPE